MTYSLIMILCTSKEGLQILPIFASFIPDYLFPSPLVGEEIGLRLLYQEYLVTSSILQFSRINEPIRTSSDADELERTKLLC
ncbi:MAG: hypothetical protein ABSB22_08125 [Thermodesulfobacteriota bacterium]